MQEMKRMPPSPQRRDVALADRILAAAGNYKQLTRAAGVGNRLRLAGELFLCVHAVRVDGRVNIQLWPEARKGLRQLPAGIVNAPAPDPRNPDPAYHSFEMDMEVVVPFVLQRIQAALGSSGDTQTRLAQAEEKVEASWTPPANEVEARDRVFAEIVRRRGQGAFRESLLVAYGRRCAVTGCDVEAALEAAHIRPYNGPDTNDVRNGLLLRADIHTLFDLNLIAVDPKTRKIRIAPALAGSAYADLARSALRAPLPGCEPDVVLLQESLSRLET